MDLAQSDSKSNEFWISTVSLENDTITHINLNKVSDTVDGIFKGLSFLSSSIDVVDTIIECSRVNANLQEFENNIDILKTIINDSADENAKAAANIIMDGMADSLILIISLADDLKEATVDMFIKALAELSPYTKAISIF